MSPRSSETLSLSSCGTSLECTDYCASDHTGLGRVWPSFCLIFELDEFDFGRCEIRRCVGLVLTVALFIHCLNVMEWKQRVML